jgi:GAF domain-containing protein
MARGIGHVGEAQVGEEWSRPEHKLPERTPLPAQPDDAFDRIADLVRKVLGVPVALVSLVDKTRQVFPGAVGLPDPWFQSRTTPLTHSFCQHVVITAGPLVVTDARIDPLVAANLAISDLGVIAYAGMPLVDAGGVVAVRCAPSTANRGFGRKANSSCSPISQRHALQNCRYGNWRAEQPQPMTTPGC